MVGEWVVERLHRKSQTGSIFCKCVQSSTGSTFNYTLFIKWGWERELPISYIYNVIIVSYRNGGGSERELLFLWRGCLVVITSVGGKSGIYGETLIIIVFG